MKKFLTLALVAFAFAFCACSEKEEDGGSSIDKNKLVGRWEVYKDVESDGEETETYYYGEEYGERQIFEFFANGTGNATMMENYGGTWHEASGAITYKLNGSNLSIKGNISLDMKIETLTATDLVLYNSIKSGKETLTVRVYFKRID